MAVIKEFQEIPVGTKSGRLTVVKDLGRFIKEGTKQKRHYVKCVCDCEQHNEVIVEAYDFKKGYILSCGCYGKEKRYNSNKKYNEYHVWNDVVFVKFTNCNEYFLCDLEDWDKLKHISWYKKENGYAINRTSGKTIYMHRMIVNCPDELMVDHKIPVGSGVCDNRKSNLRLATSSQNNRNKSKSPRNSSGYKGVSWNKQTKKWKACIGINGKSIHLGLYDDIRDAVKAYDNAAEKIHGEFAVKNFEEKGEKQ